MTGMPPTVRLRQLPELLGGLAPGVPDLAITGLSLDSRQLVQGGAFLACRGTREHGLKFVDEALRRGASVVLWEPGEGVVPPELPVPSVAVDHLSRHAGEIAARFYDEPARKLHGVGVTGTDGKTSTSYLLAQAFESLGKPCFYVGTLGSGSAGALSDTGLTTPDPVRLQQLLYEAVSGGCTQLAMEVSSHALDQARVAGVSFHTAILTNLQRDHLDYHGTVENYAAAKRKLFEPEGVRARIFNRDDETGARWAAEFPGSCVFGIEGGAPRRGHFLLARNVELDAGGIGFAVETHLGAAHIQSGLLGRFNVYNLLAALAALLESGAGLARACAALSKVRTVPGRMEGFRGPAARPLVVVDYAHTPQALEQVLDACRAHTAGKLWCVFGCGGDRDRGKRPLMGAAVAGRADRAIVTDDNPRSEAPEAIVADILAGVPTGQRAAFSVIHDRQRAIETAVREAGRDDIVVVAGKGHETTQTRGADVRPFSDRECVRRLAGRE